MTCVPGSIAGRLLFRVTVQTLWNLLEMGPCWNYCVRRTSSLNRSMLYLRSRSGMGGSDDSKGHFVIKKKKQKMHLACLYHLIPRCLWDPFSTHFLLYYYIAWHFAAQRTEHPPCSKIYRRLSHMDPFYNVSTVWCFLSDLEIGQDHCSNLLEINNLCYSKYLKHNYSHL